MVKQENNNYVVSIDSHGRYEFSPVEDFSHVRGGNHYFMNTTLYNDSSGNLVVEGKRLEGTIAGEYFPEEIVDHYTGWYEVVIDVDLAIDYINNDNPINRSAIKSLLSDCTNHDWSIYIWDFEIVKEYYYKFNWSQFEVYHEDNFTEKQIIISDPYAVIIKD